MDYEYEMIKKENTQEIQTNRKDFGIVNYPTSNLHSRKQTYYGKDCTFTQHHHNLE